MKTTSGMALWSLVLAVGWTARFPVPCAAAERGRARARLYWNGEPVAADAALAMRPGRMHTLELQGPGEGEVEVLRLLPAGEQVLERGILREGRAKIEIGPLTAPAGYDFEAGVVYRRGYCLRITWREGDRVLGQWNYAQGLADAETERLLADAPRRAVYVAAWGHQETADFRLAEARRMRPVWDLRLDPAVLKDQDRVRLVHASLLDEETGALLRITDAEGNTRFEQEIRAGSAPVDVMEAAHWPAGDYRVTLWPRVGGRLWEEGPEIVYRRRTMQPDRVRVSPLAPWTLGRDRSREEIVLENMREAHARYGTRPLNEAYWRFDARGALLSQGRAEGEPIALSLPLEGWYALFVEPVGRALVQATARDFKRVVSGTGDGPFDHAFVCAGPMPGGQLRIYPLLRKNNGVAAVRLVPVTEKSVRDLYEKTGRPPVPLFGSNDWTEYFHAIAAVGDWSPATDDQFPSILGGQAEKGIRDVGWAIGRSVLTYHSRLPNVTLHSRPCIGPMLERLDPLQEVLEAAPRSRSRIWAFLAMNRHYTGPPHSSAFYLDNPQWRHTHKDGSEGRGRMSYFFADVRRERLDILLEAAGRGVHGLQVCTVRQVPMMSYNRWPVYRYIEKTGVDPRTVDATHGAAYEDWIRWRADFFTQLLRDLRAGLDALQAARGRSTVVAVRLPSAGLFWNLAQGLDVETWLREGLVDRLLLHPLDDRLGRASHDVSPYVELGRRYGVEVYGGMGATAFVWGAHRQRGDQDIGHVPALRRALGLLRAGVDGIEIYEAELLAFATPHAWLSRLWGDAEAIQQFLENSNVEACFPVTSMNACRGFDNHSFRRWGWDVEGFGRWSL